MRHYFFKYLSMILLAGCIFLFATCASDGQDGLPVSRTVLVYVSADNSLSDYVETNFEQIQKGYGYVNGAATNLLVYMDVKNEDPRLYHIYKKSGKVKKRVLRTYPEQDSSSSEAMANVFREAYDRYPASSYGMVLAFHGAGWLPENNYLNSAKVNRDKIPTRSEQKGKEMHLDIKAISKALDSTPYLDFIVFDACLMASAEVAYELRGRCNYMIASPTEVHADGFSYDLLVRDLFSSGIIDYQSICKDFIDAYLNKEVEDERMKTATISVINLKYIEQFRLFVQKSFNKYNKEFDKLNPMKVQPYDRLTHKVFFDAQDLLFQLPLTIPEKEQLNVIMANLIPYKSATPYFINLPIDKYSGISLGYMKYQMKDLKKRYQNLNWNKKTE